ncbi:MAG TPA: 5-aminolevulinate synthase [Oligoflexia bacterium]|nr:5-aminolevulinate synthase [Oligoflexia bacterium]HMP27265.1 5-aminolevulinate synthase [Oligoflexia bacterium]
MKLSFEDIFAQHLEVLKNEGRYRIFRDISRERGNFPCALFRYQGDRSQVKVWCSNDYLAMGENPVVLEAMRSALDQFGAGAGGTRNISGTHGLIVDLEKELADLHRKEAALLFSSGYVANETALSVILKLLPNAVVISDSENHASMIAGIRASGAQKKIMAHNDPEDLKKILAEIPQTQPIVLAVESLYSMSGEFGKLKELIMLAKERGAFVYVDETHAVGVYGKSGGGVCEELGLLDLVDMLQGGLGKGFGVVGGFVTGSRNAIDAIRSFGAGFIFTTALPPVIAAGALASVRYLKSSSLERLKLQEISSYLKNSLEGAGFPLISNKSHITPLVIGNAKCCNAISERLLFENRIYIQPINYPTVPKGSERLRITPSPKHTCEDVEELKLALIGQWEKAHLSRKAA